MFKKQNLKHSKNLGDNMLSGPEHMRHSVWAIACVAQSNLGDNIYLAGQHKHVARVDMTTFWATWATTHALD